MPRPRLTFGSAPIAKIPFLEVFIASDLARAIEQGESLHLGWGAKASGRRAAERARTDGGRAIMLEDGFLRSYGTGATHPAISLSVDPVGIYYDATRPSLIENILNDDAPITGPDAMFASADVVRAMEQVRKHGLSKYNNAPAVIPEQLGQITGQKVLVVDQTAGDLSISLGLASSETFTQMLEAALAENPEATIFLKVHPEVSSGRKAGHFTAVADNQRVKILDEQIDPGLLFSNFDRVYVVSSTLGFEALLHGKDVTCFGMPWYAGWGLTDDRVACGRRTRKRRLEEVFAAGYMKYCRYIDPQSHGPGDIFSAIDWLLRQKHVESRLHGQSRKGQIVGVGMRKWKQANLSPLLATQPNGVRFVKTATELDATALSHDDSVVVWGAEPPRTVQEVVQRSNCGLLRMEDGFIRSVGLGSDLIPPLSLVLDGTGIYFNPHQRSDLERILLETTFSDEDLEQAASLRSAIVAHEVTKYNLETRQEPSWAGRDGLIVLVPGQVEDDASIRLGCPEINDNLGLLRAVRERHPHAFIVYKPHPDVWSRNRKGAVHRDEALALADHIEIGASIVSCIAAASELHTLTSLSGFDALLRGKRVVTYGEPFYAGWGLTEDVVGESENLARRNRVLTLDEMVAGALLRYPFYWDEALRGYTTAEAVVNFIVKRRNELEAKGDMAKLRANYFRRQLRKAIILFRAAIRKG